LQALPFRIRIHNTLFSIAKEFSRHFAAKTPKISDFGVFFRAKPRLEVGSSKQKELFQFSTLVLLIF
jgi:hypothetical protein